MTDAIAQVVVEGEGEAEKNQGAKPGIRNSRHELIVLGAASSAGNQQHQQHNGDAVGDACDSMANGKPRRQRQFVVLQMR